MYGLTLLVHSWLRWGLLWVALLVLLRALHGLSGKRAWSTRDALWTRVFVGLVDLQLLLGLLLYVVLSPIVRSALADLRAAMASPVLRFFGVEHVTAMVIAVTVAHVGNVRLRRATSDRARHKSILTTVGIFLLVVLIGIPWPFRPYGRALLRGVDTVTASVRKGPEDRGASSVYAARCAVCHGAAGHGDGVAAGSMHPAPRDFRELAWQRSISDEQLRAAIEQGGLSRGLSANMPAHPDLRAAELDELVRFVRARTH